MLSRPRTKLLPAAAVDGLTGLSPVYIDPRQLQRSSTFKQPGLASCHRPCTATSCVRQTAWRRSSTSEPGGRHQKEPCHQRDPPVHRFTLALQLHCLFTTCSVSVCFITHAHTHSHSHRQTSDTAADDCQTTANIVHTESGRRGVGQIVVQGRFRLSSRPDIRLIVSAPAYQAHPPSSLLPASPSNNYTVRQTGCGFNLHFMACLSHLHYQPVSVEDLFAERPSQILASAACTVSSQYTMYGAPTRFACRNLIIQDP